MILFHINFCLFLHSFIFLFIPLKNKSTRNCSIPSQYNGSPLISQPARFYRLPTVTVHAYVPSNEICRGFAFKYGKFLLPPRFLTALSVPKVPTHQQLFSLSHISIKIAFSYSYHDADTIFPVSFIFTASSFRAPCLFLLDRNGPNVSSRSRRTIYIQTKPPE